MKKVFNVEDDHTPDNTSEGGWVGVEIECYIPYRAIAELADVEVDDEGDATSALADLLEAYDVPNVTIKGDGSISAPGDGSVEYFETEIAILFKRNNKKPLKNLCTLLKKLKTGVNTSCGLHVHLDCRDLEMDTARRWDNPIPQKVIQRGRALENALPIMLQMVARSRRNNSYCRPEMSTTNRSAINLTAFNKHGTIEVRLHQGSTDYYKIANWVDFLYRVSRSKKSMSVETVAQLKRFLGKNHKRLSSYAKKRINEMNKRERDRQARRAAREAEREAA